MFLQIELMCDSVMKNRFKAGIQEHKNLTIYTSPFENDENLEAVEPIIETLLAMHTVVLMDCDFETPMRYFKYDMMPIYDLSFL